MVAGADGDTALLMHRNALGLPGGFTLLLLGSVMLLLWRQAGSRKLAHMLLLWRAPFLVSDAARRSPAAGQAARARPGWSRASPLRS